MSNFLSLIKGWGVILCGLLPLTLSAQEISVGTWRSHISFNAINSISLTSTKAYATCSNGVIVVDMLNNEIATLTKLNGLSSTGISQVAADDIRKQTLIGYEDGNLDIITKTEIINFDRLKTSSTITGSKRINHININGSLAYISTDYGVVVFDLIKLEVRETYRDLGSSGEKIKINQSVFLVDSIFLATEQGVLIGNRNDNLLDFNNWKRFNTGAFSGNVQSIASYNSTIYSAINNSGIYKYTDGTWILESSLQGLTFKNITGGLNNLVVTENENVWLLNGGGVSALSSEKITDPLIAVEDASGKFWIGDGRNGLVSNMSGTYESYLPNGPSFSGGLRMQYSSGLKKLFIVSGGFSAGAPLQKTESLNSFSNGTWEESAGLLDQDLTDVEISGNRIILSSFGKGVEAIDNGSISFQDETTCTNVSAMATSSLGIWVASYGVSESLSLLASDFSWTSFSFPIAASQYPTDLLVDYLGSVWMVLNPNNGGGILAFDKKNNRTAYLTDASGSGGLPSRYVYSIVSDRDGQIWVGTSAGVAYFPNPSGVFTGAVNAVKPIFENRYLLRDEKINAIEVDGGNRKWVGTDHGVWLFDPFGENQIQNFNTVNSPLISDKIVDIEINSSTGEVFFMTDVGIVSYRSDATNSNEFFQSVKIFPNPVTSHFNGQVAISGLSTDAFVKITDVSGKLIWQTQANGGTATWNVRDYNGNRAATGMYLVISTAENGVDSIIGKIAVVN